MQFPLLSTRLLALAASLVACVLAAGCDTLANTPKVDIYQAPERAATPVEPVRRVATGGLYSAASYRPAFEDRRARLVGDIVTISISENVTASQKQTSSIDKSNTSSAAITALPLLKAGTFGQLNLGGSSSSAFEGKGGTESANTFTGSITATVVEVLPNGNLVVVGEKQIGVNQNVDVLKFSGTIDPRSIGSGNLVSSLQVANVRVESRGRGAQQESQIMPFLARFFMSVLPL